MATQMPTTSGVFTRASSGLVRQVKTQDVMHYGIQQIAVGQTVQYEIQDAEMPSKQCISLALVINELVSNALKHGKSKAAVRMLRGLGTWCWVAAGCPNWRRR